MMQVLLNSRPVAEQQRLRREVQVIQEQIASRQRNHQFKNLTEEQKQEVKQSLTAMVPLLQRIDQLAIVYYIVSENAQQVKQLYEMKYLFREQIQWFQQGRYILDAADLLKLKVNCDRMFNNVREHLSQVAKSAKEPAFAKGLKAEDLKLPPKRKPKPDAAKAAEAAIKKQAEADPLAWAIQQVETYYTNYPPTPPKSERLSQRVLPESLLDDDAGVFDLFMNINKEEPATEPEFAEEYNHWSMAVVT